MENYLKMTNGGQANDNDFSTNNQTVNHIYLLPGANQTEFNKWMDKIGSLLHLADEHINLKPILDLLIAVIEPERIFLIKTPEIEGYDIEGNIEILLVIPAACKISFEEFEPLLKMASLKKQNIVFSLHSADEVDEALKNGHPLYSIHCIEDNMVFSESGERLTVTAPDILLELKAIATDHFNTGMEMADEFLTSAEHDMEMKPQRIAGILLHQAAEQIYKAISSSLGAYIQKTHKLTRLAKIACRYAPPINNAFKDDNALLFLLDRAYALREDPDFKITDEEIRCLHTHVKSLQQISTLFFKARLKSFDRSNPGQILNND